MIWHETNEPAVIVMLTQTHESGKEKCFPYFPESMDAPTLQVNEDDEFGDGFSATVTLKSVNEDKKTHSTIRELDLVGTDGVMGAGTVAGPEAEENDQSNDNDHENHRTVWHLLFAGWPDFFVPESDDRAALLALIKLSEHLSREGRSDRDDGKNDDNTDPSGNKSRNPRIVHCSAGVGRSGTFIALDYLLSEMEDGVFDPGNVDASTVNDVNYGMNNMISSNQTSNISHSGNDDDDNNNDNDEAKGSKILNSNNDSNDTDRSDYDDPIADTVDRLRKQRMMMVQTEPQYAFLYVVMREAMLRRLEGLMNGVGARNGKGI